ncbi:MAG: YbaN family protein [Roseburia sp.]
MRKIGNTICVILGFICFGIGAFGAVLPILPTTPFLLLAAALFAKGSERFHKWFVETNLYQKYIEQAVKKKAMGKREKRNMLLVLGTIFAVGIIFSPVFAKVILVIVALLHFYYFLFRVKTVPSDDVVVEEQ